jgi:hypothetical protein
MTTKLAFATTNISDKMIGMDNLKLLVHTAHQSLDYIPNLMQCLMST